MKDAFSPIYQEYLDAFQVGYHQMAELQVVCPCCREAVYRAEREYPTGPTAYFSHYGAAKAFNAECERRVASISSSDRERTNQESRNQSIAIFRAVLRDAVAPIAVKGRLLAEQDRSWELIEFGHRLSRLVLAVLRQNVLSIGRDKMRDLTFSNAKRLLKIRGIDVKSTARPSIRSNIAADLVISMLSDHSDRTSTYLLARSIFDCFDKKPGKPEKEFLGWTRALQVALHNDPIELTPGMTSKDDMDVIVILDCMLRELERLPYEKMIVNARKGLRPLQGVTIDDYLPKQENPELQYAIGNIDKMKVAKFDASLEGKTTRFIPPGERLFVDPPIDDDDYVASTPKI
ncbi:hypothetical protein [Rhizobium sp. MHM7A]|uniref:hypothetical protein n=1 Tax=Rhizobium sp. MHM7A TaxID=2583233 RepID=UPI00110627DB|nr:hypothetical protein [Rhizobium sp. MHM7A]TLX16041.1 hypothetical protein FFR93_01605 [Rhizobium sp. MHM7A]